jgi:hypothetical protein
MVSRKIGKKVIRRIGTRPLDLFFNSMRAPMTRDRYQTRVAKFLEFIGIRGRTLEQKARTFAKKGKRDTNWALGKI